MVFIHRFLPAGLILLLLVGSPVEAGKEDGRGQGRWRRAFVSAIKDADTWAPAAAAAAIAVGSYDKKISDWATRTTPLFGSREAAVKASDDLRLASDIGMAASSFFLTRQSGGSRSIQGRTAYTGVGYAGAIFSTGMTDALKAATGRLRPDGSNTGSLPSGHTSRAFAYAAFSQRTLRKSGPAQGRPDGAPVEPDGTRRRDCLGPDRSRSALSHRRVGRSRSGELRRKIRERVDPRPRKRDALLVQSEPGATASDGWLELLGGCGQGLDFAQLSLDLSREFLFTAGARQLERALRRRPPLDQAAASNLGDAEVAPGQR